MSKGIVQIDGSHMEGGGAVVRLATALSVLTKKPVRIFSIRANRPNPGLRTQHLRGLQAIAGFCGARLEGAALGSREIFFYPGKVSEKRIEISIETAGSVGLVLQSLLIAAMRAKERVVIEINGGATFGKYAPPLQYIQFVLLPVLRRMGYQVEINILRHGFYPVGGARVQVIVNPCGKLSPAEMGERGDVETVDILSTASSGLKKPRVAERQTRAALDMLKARGYDPKVRSVYSDSKCPGSGVVVVAKTSNGCFLGSDGLGEKGKPAEQVGEEAAAKLLGIIDSGATVDEHMSDQILPYMALAEGKSSVVAPALTSHAETNMWVIRQFLGIDFRAEKEGANVRISV